MPSLLPIPTMLLYGIVAAAVLVYLPFPIIAYNRLKIENGLVTPRAIVDQLPPYAQRATWAHQNSFEAFVLFAAASLMAYITQVDATLAGWAVLAFVVARSLYAVFYILNIPPGRSLMFAIGSLSSSTLFILSLLRVSG